MLLRTEPNQAEKWIENTLLSGGAGMNYYTVLGVSPDATRHEIESAYVKLLRKQKHIGQGKNNGDIKSIRTAYTVLSDPDRRRRYNEENGFLYGYINKNIGDAATTKRKLPAYCTVLLLMFASLAVGLVYSLIIRPPIEYHRASLLIGSERYKQAYGCLKHIGDYRDSAELRAELLQILQNSGNRRAVSAGGRHTVGLKKDGTVVAVGDNQYGQLDVAAWCDIVAQLSVYGTTSIVLIVFISPCSGSSYSFFL